MQAYEALSYWRVCGLKLLVYAALSYCAGGCFCVSKRGKGEKASARESWGGERERRARVGGIVLQKTNQ